jgi:putative nucleotidyltransferase with HDIG domain
VALVSFLNHYVGWLNALLIVPIMFWIYRSYHLYLARLEGERKRAEMEALHVEAEKRHVEEVCALHLRTIEGLALAIDARDHTTHCHLHRVRTYAVEVGKEMGLSDQELDALRAAALLHDIGKLAVPDHIINKPGRLTPEEFEKMKIHPLVGAGILEKVAFPYPVAPIVRSHHEKWNGEGYPDGLKGEEIPIGARILTAADCLDALASDRQYRKALPLEQAMKQIVRDSAQPRTFNPLLVADEASETVRYLTGGVLVRLSRASQQLEPELATAWKVNRAGNAITFTLREGVRFSDGASFSADDVAYTMQQLMDPALHSPTGDSFRSGDGKVTTRVEGKYRITTVFPAPVVGLDKLFDQVAILSASSKQKEMSVLGPYYMAENKSGSYLLLARNPNYWKQMPPAVHFLTSIPSASTSSRIATWNCCASSAAKSTSSIRSTANPSTA